MKPYRYCALAAVAFAAAGASAQFTSVDMGNPPPKTGETIEVTPMKKYTVTGYGTSFGSFSASDQGRFVYTKLSGDFDISVRIDNVRLNTVIPEIHLMVRKSLDPKDLFFCSGIIYDKPDHRWVNRLQCRSIYGGRQDDHTVGGWGCSWAPLQTGQTGPFPDYWLRVKREGNALRGYYKVGSRGEWIDNVRWGEGMRTTWNKNTNLLAQTFVDLGKDVYVGMAISSDVDRQRKGNEPVVVTFADLTGFEQASPK